MIEPDDHRVVWYRLAPQLKVQKDGKDADLLDFIERTFDEDHAEC